MNRSLLTPHRSPALLLVLLLLAVASVPHARAQEAPGGDAHRSLPGYVLAHQKVSATHGGFTGTLGVLDYFGGATASIGDLDGDGTADLAVGAPVDDDGGTDRGAVWVLFMHPNGTVRAHQKISSLKGGFTGTLTNADTFGSAIASLGDLDGDGVADLAVGAPGDDDSASGIGNAEGAVWILFLNTNGTVKAHQKISAIEGGFLGPLDSADVFGASVAAMGDLDGDGLPELTAGAIGDDDGVGEAGAVWVLFLNANGTVRAHRKISNTEGGFTGTLGSLVHFGGAVTSVGDLDGDAVPELAVGAYNDDGLGWSRGAVWVLFMNANGTVRTHQKISDSDGSFTGILDNGDYFGYALTALGDLDGDGTSDLAVGAVNDDDGGTASGAVWVLFLDPLGRVRFHQKISATEGGFTGGLVHDDYFGWSMAALGDLDGDGVTELAVGAPGDDDGAGDAGAVWVLFLDGEAPDLTVSAVPTSGAPVPPEGGVLRYTVTVTNRTDDFAAFDLWMVAYNAEAGFERRFGLSRGHVLNPHESRTYARVQQVPAEAPAGLYDLTAYAGSYPTGVVASATFPVEKLAAEAAPLAYPVSPVEGWDGTWQEVGETTGAAVTAHGEVAHLSGAAPNPFAGRTTLSFTLAEATAVRLTVYDVLGREVAVLVDEYREAGTHAVAFEASSLPSGTYLVRLRAGAATQTQRLTLAH
jgi:hypothetical protein